ncbi:MAG: hypothetical protein VB100_06315 [Angelakisella sp.]|nr:hypothetical protein [Angelakisella sp.]
MKSDSFEIEFSHFLDGASYDMAQEEFSKLMRMAFEAGWRAAGGASTVPSQSKTFLLFQENSANGK